jgi:hypothetical protein
MAEAQSALQQANNSRSQALNDARNNLEYEKRRAQRAIDDAWAQVQYAKNKMDREFGRYILYLVMYVLSLYPFR